MPWGAHHSDLGADEKPTRFGRFDVVRELGKGGMAYVYEGRHSELGKRVALKVMQPALAAHPMAAERFLREAKAAAQIRHQHVVEVFDVDTEKGLPFIVMEFLEGSNLAALLSEKGPLSLAGIVDVFLPVISAVATAHAKGIIHRDLKPANLMLTSLPPRAMHPMVLDFGISKVTSEELDSTFTRSESLLGTVHYMAPELTRGAKFASPASDQYALGVMLYECATGQRPFAGASHYELMHAIVTAPFVPPSRLRPGLPPEFDAIVERAMHRDAAKRFASVVALGSALLSFGDKRAWALWESEFVGTPETAPWEGTGETVSDEKAAGRSEKTNRSVKVRRRRTPWVVLPLTAYAAVATALLVRNRVEVPKPAAGEVAPPPAVTVQNVPAEPQPEKSTPAEAVPKENGLPHESAAQLAISSSPPRPMAPTRRTPATASPSAAAARPSGTASPPITSGAARPAVNEGANGAPILE